MTLSSPRGPRPLRLRVSAAAVGLSLPALLLLAPAAQAHHLMELLQLQPTPLSGLISGLLHPVIGPDHLLFLLALAGSALAQLVQLPAAMTGWVEALTAVSLALEGLVALSVLPAAWLLPLFGLHGFLLGNMIVGAEPTPLLAYFAGLLLGQGALLLLVTGLSQRLLAWLGTGGQRLAAGIWIGIGCALAWTALVV